MSDKQPEALRLADLIFDKPDSDGHCMKAAAELRRLYALCEEMGEALERIAKDEWKKGCESPSIAKKALAKWEESNNKENHNV